MKKRELTLFQNKLFLAGVYVDARYRILLSHAQTEIAKIRLMEVALKSHYNAESTASSSNIAAAVEDECTQIIDGSQASSSEDEFEKELDLLQ